MFVVTENKTLTNQEAFASFGLRREGGKTKFSPQKLIEAFGPNVFPGNISFIYKDEVKKVFRPGTCVVRVGGLGDLVILSSSLNKLKRKNPNTPLILATVPEHQRVFGKLKCLDDCISIFNLNQFEFDKVINLQWAVEPKELAPERGKLPWKYYVGRDRSEIFDRLCGMNGKKRFFEVPVNERMKDEMKGLVGNGKPVVGFSPTCRAQHRAIPNDYVRPILNRLTKDYRVVLFGKTEKWNGTLKGLEMPGLINLLDKTSANKAIALCSVLDLLITPDSGFLHVAGAMGIKCLGVFGNIDPKTRTAYYPSVKTLYAKDRNILGCCPCWDLHENCNLHRNSVSCMRMFTPDDIVGKAKRMLNA
jgi:ADP-heptose:LPS heptosyltransferase